MKEKDHLHLPQERRKLEIHDYNLRRTPGPMRYKTRLKQKYGMMEALIFCILSSVVKLAKSSMFRRWTRHVAHFEKN